MILEVLYCTSFIYGIYTSYSQFKKLNTTENTTILKNNLNNENDYDEFYMSSILHEEEFEKIKNNLNKEDI